MKARSLRLRTEPPERGKGGRKVGRPAVLRFRCLDCGEMLTSPQVRVHQCPQYRERVLRPVRRAGE